MRCYARSSGKKWFIFQSPYFITTIAVDDSHYLGDVTPGLAARNGLYFSHRGQMAAQRNVADIVYNPYSRSCCSLVQVSVIGSLRQSLSQWLNIVGTDVRHVTELVWPDQDQIKKMSNFVLQPLGTLIKLWALSSQLSLYQILKFWNFEILKFWNFEILKFWNFEILKFWNFEIFNEMQSLGHA